MFAAFEKSLLIGSVLVFLAQGAVFGQESQVRQEEAQDYYKKWLDEDVYYIITEEERSVFSKLTTADEKDQFIEQFWRRRDPDLTTVQNEFREEHYRRIAYANENFHSGVPGWKTDRGWVYIKYGPPDGLEKHPEGGFYARKHHEGGGYTETYPFEVWFYNHIDGVGDGVELEFVDASKSNHYALAMDSDEKDAMLYVPGAGLTTGEYYGSVSRLDRIRFRHMADELDFRYRRAQDFPMQRLQTLYNLQQAPQTKFKDLEKVVDVRISYQQLPMEVRIDQLRINPDVALIPVTLFVPTRELSFEPVSEGIVRATLEVYGKVESVRGALEYVFEDTVKRDIRQELFDQELTGPTIYQKRLPLKAGRYKLSLVVREVATGKLRTLDRLILVENKDTDELFCSTPILTPSVKPLSEGRSQADPYVLTYFEVYPSEKAEFRTSDAFVQSYFEVYNLGIDQATFEPSATVELSLLYWGGPGDKLDSPREVFPYTQIQNEFAFVGDRLVVYKTIPFGGLMPGKYTVRFRINDKVGSGTVEQKVDFTIVS